MRIFENHLTKKPMDEQGGSSVYRDKDHSDCVGQLIVLKVKTLGKEMFLSMCEDFLPMNGFKPCFGNAIK